MGIKPRFILPLLLFVLLISYQNFTPVRNEGWDSEKTMRIMNEMSLFEKNQSQKSMLASPDGGSDLKSVQDNWTQRQGSLLLNGYDKKLEGAVNDKLNSWVRALTEDDKKETSADPAQNSAGASNPSSTDASTSTTSPKKRQLLRFSRINSLKYDLGENTCFDVTADPGNTYLNFSQSLSASTRLGLEHRTSDNKTQMLFRYEW